MLEPAMTQGRRIHGLDAAEREAARRDQILETAWTVFAELGYAGTSVEHICARANVSTKSFYRIFENREHLYLALYEEFSKEAFDRIAGVMELARQDAPHAADYFLDALVSAYFEDPRRGLVVVGPQRAVTPAVERARRETRSRAAEMLMLLWREYGRSEEQVGVAVAVIGGIFDLFTMQLVDGRPPTPAEQQQMCADLRRYYRAVTEGLSSLG